MYPPSLTSTQENVDRDRADVLDMNVVLDEGVVYCKADAFHFNVVSLPFLESNLDSGVCYRVFYGQTVRFQRLCTHRVDFEERIRFLLEVLKGREYEVRLLCRQFCRAVEGYLPVFQRWDIPVDLGVWF